jgi:hypothetical protein
MNNAFDPIAVPRGGLDLLVRAALAPEAKAREAWRRWRAEHDLDTTSWSEVRMLAAVASRIATLEEVADVRPRVEGIRKFLWVHTQMCLEPAGPALKALSEAGIPVLLTKGAARVVAQPASAHERLIRDVDVLVPLKSAERALALVRGAGWTLREPPWAMRARAASTVAGHHAWTVTKGRGEIDLHHFSNHLNRLTGDDDGLWQRATTHQWRGATVHLPAPADALVLAVTHGVRWSRDGAADWTVDAAHLVAAGTVDWDVVLAEADSRVLHAALHAGLGYLRDALGCAVPAEVLHYLESRSTDLARAELAWYASRPDPATATEKQAALAMAVRRAFVRAGIPDGGHRGPLTVLPLTEVRGTLAPGDGEVTCPIPQASLHEWLLVHLELDATSLPATTTLSGELRAPGLGIGDGPGKRRQTAAGRPVLRFEGQLPAALTTFRHLERVSISLRCGNEPFAAPAAMPVTVTWHRLVRT